MSSPETGLSLPVEVIAALAKLDFNNVNEKAMKVLTQLQTAARKRMMPHVPSQRMIDIERRDHSHRNELADWAEWSKEQLGIEECENGPGCKVCK